MNTYLFIHTSKLGWIKISELNWADTTEENLIEILSGAAKTLELDASSLVGLMRVMRPYQYKVIQAHSFEQATKQLGEMNHGK